MHNQSDFDDPKQNENDEFKQDLQLIRYEITNNLKKTRDDNMRNMFIINTGLECVAEEIANANNNNKSPNNQFLRYKELLSSYQSPSKIDLEQTPVENINEIQDQLIIESNEQINQSVEQDKIQIKQIITELDKIEVSST